MRGALAALLEWGPRGALASAIAVSLGLAGCSSAASGARSGGPGPVVDAAGSDSDVARDAGGGGTGLDATAVADATADAPGCAPMTDAGAPVLFYDLKTAPFPDASTPSVAVHVPPGFDPGHRPGVIVFFHGFENCVANVVGDVDTPCTDGGAARAAMHLVDQLDAARVNAILVAVELEVDAETGNPGQLATAGDFRALLQELFTEHLDTVLGCPLDVDSLDRVVVSSHSGGYEAAASVLAYGMVPAVREVDLLDSLYGELTTFYDWVKDDAVRFDSTRADELRWMDIYTESGGTAANSRDMAVSAKEWLDDAGLPESVLFDDTTDTLDASSYQRPVLFKLSALSHDEVPQYYFEEFARASGFATIP